MKSLFISAGIILVMRGLWELKKLDQRCNPDSINYDPPKWMKGPK